MKTTKVGNVTNRSQAGGEMPEMPLFLEDLHVGQRFTSGSYAIDEKQIKALATMRLLVQGGLPIAGGLIGAPLK